LAAAGFTAAGAAADGAAAAGGAAGAAAIAGARLTASRNIAIAEPITFIGPLPVGESNARLITRRQF
jgi:hypothetical protein